MSVSWISGITLYSPTVCRHETSILEVESFFHSVVAGRIWPLSRTVIRSDGALRNFTFELIPGHRPRLQPTTSHPQCSAIINSFTDLLTQKLWVSSPLSVNIHFPQTVHHVLIHSIHVAVLYLCAHSSFTRMNGQQCSIFLSVFPPSVYRVTLTKKKNELSFEWASANYDNSTWHLIIALTVIQWNNYVKHPI